MKRLSAFGALVLIAPLLVPRAASADDDILVPTAADDRAVSSCLQRAEEDGTAPAACIVLAPASMAFAVALSPACAAQVALSRAALRSTAERTLISYATLERS